MEGAFRAAGEGAPLMSITPLAIGRDRVESALRVVRERLLAEMHPDGHWEGRLSSSALATATAISAMAAACPDANGHLIEGGLGWLVRDQNSDGGWGDTPDSPSNLSTTMLAVSALTLAAPGGQSPALAKAEDYLARHAGRTAEERAAALAAVYGKDRTFAAPILVNAALAGLIPWDRVPRLPFELSVLPHGWYRVLRLHVVSYALPALIAVGLVLHRRNPPRSQLTRMWRNCAETPALRKLAAIQPSSGGFLEAVPLTSFVAMSLSGAGHAQHAVTRKCVEFLRRAARSDGSWPIDSNLSVWLTSNAAIALDAAGGLAAADAARTRRWLLEMQHRTVHPYTNTAAGGWSWTHLPGGVPDVDDTARAMLALDKVSGGDALGKCSSVRTDEHFPDSRRAGLRWLIQVQNRDGGWPTFCRGWGKLPFDRSAPDLTAHVLQALGAIPADERDGRIRRAVRHGVEYLRRSQLSDGSWLPLWFGNQFTSGHANPVLGTAFVLPALLEVGERDAARKGLAYLVGAQTDDGGWGGATGVMPSVEETAVAVSALAQSPLSSGSAEAQALDRAADWLLRKVEAGAWSDPSPIGLYFSKLWYSEKLYPIIWMTESLGRVVSMLRCKRD